MVTTPDVAPEHSARFRPASPEDFSRCAKALAQLLGCPLSTAQEVLARAYGYAHRHELQQSLSKPGAAGPYDDVLLEELDSAAAQTVLQARWAAMMRAIAWHSEDKVAPDWPDEWMLACDLGLFSTPGAHRTAQRGVTAFLQTERGFSSDGFPFGYRGCLFSRYQARRPVDERALRDFRFDDNFPFEGRGFVLDPQAHLDYLRSFRAPQLFARMASRRSVIAAMAALGGGLELEFEPAVYYNALPKDFSLLLGRFDVELGDSLRCWWKTTRGEELSEAQQEALAAAIRRPSAQRVAASEVASSIPAFVEQLAAWRLRIRQEVAHGFEQHYQTWDDEGLEDVAVLRIGRERWHLSVRLRKLARPIDITTWEVQAVLLRTDDASGAYVPVAALSGEYILPYDGSRYSGLADVLSYFDDGDNEHSERVWQLLRKQYFPRARIPSYDEWVQSGRCVVANLWPWVAPQWRGTDVSAKLFEYFFDAFDGGTASSWDGCWATWCDPEVGDDGMADVYFEEPTVIFLCLWDSGLLSFSTRNRPSYKSRAAAVPAKGTDARRVTHRPASAKSALGRRLLEVVRDIPTDFVLYDPMDPEPEEA